MGAFPQVSACEWREAAPKLRHALGPDVALIAEEHAAGEVQVWSIDDGRCYLCTRAERTADGRELVIVAAEGRGLVACWPFIAQRAAALGFDSIRFHATNPAMGRMARAHGFVEVERVYKVHTDGRT